VDGSPAALKLFNPGDDRRVQRELDLLHKIDCPNLVKVLASDHVQLNGANLTLVAYELHCGGDLRSLLAPSLARLDERDLIQLGYQVGTAADALWRKRIVHRDIKPANVVRAEDGRCVLVDVGLARHLDRSALTAFGFTVGTPGYMSPEQARGRRELTIHSDAFSLGVTIYEIAAKAHPFGRDQSRIIGGVYPAPLDLIRQDLGKGFVRAVHQLMSFAPVGRPKALADHFTPFMTGGN
jgi:serine/threonine protein kinase